VTVLVLSNCNATRRELLGKARELGGDVATVLFKGCDCDTPGSGSVKSGADKVFMVKPEIGEYNVDAYVAASAAAVEACSPDIILIASTKDGKEFGAKLAAKLDKPLAVDCMDVRLDGGNLEIDRIMYGGSAVSTQVFTTKPAIATIGPRTYDPPELDEGRTGEIVDLNAEIPAAKATITNETQKTSESVDLTAATIIVSCGRGIKNKEDIAMVEKLAKTLDAEVGCSRPIASDLKWLSVDHWVGLSGKKVKPQMYIALGISGQIQHLAGMRDSKVIVAINKDADAPIFKAAEYGIVGDIYKIVDELAAKLQ